MKGDYKKHAMCCVDMSVMVYFLIQQWLKIEKQPESVDSFILNTLGSASSIQIKESTLTHCFSITQCMHISILLFQFMMKFVHTI